MDGELEQRQLDQLLDLDSTGELLVSLTTVFRRSGPESVTGIVEAAASQDVDAVRRSAPTLKGSAATFGAKALTTVANELEHRARAGELPEPAALDRLRDALAATLEQLEQVGKQLPPAGDR